MPIFQNQGSKTMNRDASAAPPGPGSPGGGDYLWRGTHLCCALLADMPPELCNAEQ